MILEMVVHFLFQCQAYAVEGYDMDLCKSLLQAWQGGVLSFAMKLVFMVFYLCG